MRIHFAWVGPARFMMPASHALLTEIFSTGILELDLEIHNSIPGDVGGYLSFLESIVKNNTSNIEIYFHCYGHLVPVYLNFFKTFCDRMRSKYGSSLNPNFYQVVAFEESLTEFSRINLNLSHLMRAYLSFTLDRRVVNVRHRVNFRDMFNYCILYLYGGYTFDTNVYALELKNLNPIQTRTIFSSNLSTLNDIPLLNTLEPILAFDRPFLIDNPTIQQIIEPPQNKSSLRYFIYINGMFHYSITGFRVVLRRGTYRLLNTDCNFDIYALRAQQQTHELIAILEYMISKLFTLLSNFIETLSVAVNVRAYYAESIRIILTAPMIEKLNRLRETPENNIIALKSARPNHLELFAATVTALGKVSFLQFPLIKHGSGSHTVRPEYLQENIYQNECAAIRDILTPAIQAILTSLR